MGPGKKPFRKKDDKTFSRDSSPKRKRIVEESTSQTIRLNKYIAQSGVCSRREADELIKSGKIKVNTKVITEMGYQVKAEDKVYHGKVLLSKERLVYILINKPKDFITTTDDPQERKTVMQLVANACDERIYPVGRLDRNTTGVLLLTNDGELAKKLTHPSHQIGKVYQIELNKPIEEEHFLQIKEGIELEDGLIKVDDIAILDESNLALGIEIHSGKNRIVRRIFESFGYDVLKLDRVMFAGLTKKDLSRGKWRFLKDREIVKLKYLN
jgi:23S rRNA pseudouridine2605 synthase